MRGGVLPPALLCAALGLALALAPRRAWGLCLLVLATTATAIACAPVPAAWIEGGFLGCWISIAINASIVLAPLHRFSWRLYARAALALSFNAGAWSGVVIALAGSPSNLALALPCVLVVLPAAWIVDMRALIALKVVASWLIAIAILAATLQCLYVTPGYLPDHIE